MWTAKIESIGEKHILRIKAQNYYAASDEPFSDIEVTRSFDEIEDATNYFISCAHTYMSGTFDILNVQLNSVAPIIFHGNVVHDLFRIKFMDNWHKFKELKELFSQNSSSVWKRANLLCDNYELIYTVIPKKQELQYDYYLQMLKDILKVASQIKRAMGARIEIQKDWFKIEESDIQDIYPLKNEVA